MNIKKIADQLILHEGLRLKPYHCPAGKHTIGIGRNLEDKGITEKEAFSQRCQGNERFPLVSSGW